MMKKRFNINGVCSSELHYMVDISKKIDKITEMVRQGDYFTINRARQYGKTTTLSLLENSLKDEYIVIHTSFEGLGEESFSSEQKFANAFVILCGHAMKLQKMDKRLIDKWLKEDIASDILTLGMKISDFIGSCEKDVVLFIDEVDKTSNNQLFLSFLGMLRSKYLNRLAGEITYKSVILAGVYDIKNIKLKLREDEQRSYNSPWNIAASFDIDMSFSADEIATMLNEYENDYIGNKQSLFQGMNITEISNEIYRYTRGYPYLVSDICKIIDEQLSCDWSVAGVHRAVGEVLREKTPLFESIIKNLEDYPELNSITKAILLSGDTVLYNIDNRYIDLGVTVGLFKRDTRNVEFYNTIFETRIYNYMISMTKFKTTLSGDNKYIENGKLNMEYVLTRFQALMKSEYRSSDDDFIEKQGRLLFLCFLKPIINGTGHYAVEAQTRENTRMDIVVFYGGEEFIIELKVWHGDRMNSQARDQLREYLNSRGQSKGYLVSFSFNESKEYTSGWTKIGDKDIFEIIV